MIQPILAALQVRETVNRLLPSQADVDLGQVVVVLVLNRLLAPQPVYEIQDWLGETVLPEVLGITVKQAYDNRLGRTLDRLYPQLGELWQCLVSQPIRVYNLDLTALHWDLTSIYFEGAYADSQLVNYGYNRDQRPDAKQINLEVDVTHDGLVPVLYRVLAGNTADITRPLPHLAALLHFLARPELAERHLQPLLISDCKMITADAVLVYHRHGLYYLGQLQDGTAFKGQDGVEKRFRTIKGPLVVHPLFVRSDQRIEGLVFITLLALLVRAIAERLCRQHGLALTADRLLSRFASLQAVDVTWADGSVQRRAAEMSEFQVQVLAASRNVCVLAFRRH